MDENEHGLDLPLHSNIDTVKVTHYILELTGDVQKKIFYGSVVLVLAFLDGSSVAGGPDETISGLQGGTSDVIDAECVEKLKNQKCQSELNNQYSAKRETHEEESGLSNGQDDSTIKKTINNTAIPDCEREPGTQQISSAVEPSVRYTNHDIAQTEVTDMGNIQTLGGSLEILDTFRNLEQGKGDKSVHSLLDERLENSSSETENDRNAVSSNVSTGSENDFPNMFEKDVELSDHNYTSSCSENEEANNPDFVMVLDAWDLHISSVNEIYISSSSHDTCTNVLSKEEMAKLKELSENSHEKPLRFLSEKTSLKIWKAGIKHTQGFPRFVRISYQTQPCGSSLKWTSDQDGRSCVFTHGHWINNRSLFPSQDVPGALATWQAYIHVPEDMTVLMSGDENPVVRHSEELKTYIYHTALVVPTSTLALAVGYWKEIEILPCQRPSISDERIPCRLFTPAAHHELASSLLSSYIPRCMDAAFSVLGSHPFKRLDILIVPASFASLGMASPSLLFLSQSVLSNDGHMLVRVAHEMSHSWFGLAIGPRDWHEEWLSEGFCTYTESVIHAKATQVTHEEFLEEREIHDHIKQRVLEAEVESTSTELQTLRNANSDFEGGSAEVKNTVKYVSNGMNPDKGFLQIHYLKGYFLLRFLEDAVGYRSFLGFLKDLVKEFHHMLIDSMDVLGLFFKKFPEIRSAAISEESILEDWLNSPGLPKVALYTSVEQNKFVEEVSVLESQVKECSNFWRNLHWSKRRKLDMECVLQVPKLKTVQLLLLQDRLLDMPKIHPQILYYLNKTLGLAKSNADVRHKWCELVVKNKLEESYKDVQNFLLQHQAMGVYLFGELIITRDKKQRKLAEECFTRTSDDMEEGVKNVVQGMIYGR